MAPPATTRRSPVDGEQVVETGGAEVRERPAHKIGRAPSTTPRSDARRSPAQTGRRGAGEPPLRAGRQARDPATPADEHATVPRRAQHDVDAVTAQPRRLVEAVRRAARRPQVAEHPRPCSLRRRAPERQLEVALARPPHASNSAHDRPRAPDRSRPACGGSSTSTTARSGRADLARRARCDRAGRPARCPTTSRRARPLTRAAPKRNRGSVATSAKAAAVPAPSASIASAFTRAAIASTPPRTASTHDTRAATQPHITGSLGPSAARCAGPIPGTASSSATEWNAPCACR